MSLHPIQPDAGSPNSGPPVKIRPNRWLAGWHWLVDDPYPAQINDKIERRNAQLLESLLISMSLFGVIISFLQNWLMPEQSTLDPGKSLLTDGDTAAFLGALVVWAGALWMIRLGYHKVASLIAIVTAIVAIFVGVSTDGDLGDLPTLVIPLLITAMLFPLRTTMMAILITLGGLLLLPLNPYIAVSALVTRPFSFVFICMILIYLAFDHRDRVERERQRELAENEARYRSLFVAAFEGFAIHEQGQIVDCNPGLATMFGFEVEELADAPLILLFAPESHPALEAHLLDETDDPIEAVGLMKDGRTLFLEVVNRQQVQQGKVIAVLAVRDITQRKVAEEALRSAQKIDSLGMLAGSVAHDFNNMLQAMMGQMSMAMAKSTPESLARPYLEKAIKSAQLAAKLTRQLLAYAGRDPAERTVIDLNYLIRDSQSLFESRLSRKDWLRLYLSNDTDLIHASDAQIRQVLVNLVINASEAIDPNSGIVAVRTRRVVVDSNFVTAHFVGHTPLLPGEYACLEVADNGSGMDETTARRIFDPFFTTKSAGHGLGLSTTFGIVRAHHGAIRLISAPGHGATFTVLIPAMASAPKLLNVPATPAFTKRLDAGTVLVIDDEQPVLETVIDMLMTSGLRVLSASDGQEGVQIYDQRCHEIDLVLLDVRMPRLDGVQTFALLTARNPTVQVIFSSGYSESEAVNQLVAQGKANYLSKPYNFAELIDKVQSALHIPLPN